MKWTIPNIIHKEYILCTLIIICFAQLPAVAQNTFEEYRAQKRAEFDRYRNSKREAFEAYRAKKNREFADLLSQKWGNYNLSKGRPQPKKPDPVTPTVAPKEEEKPTKPIDLPFGKVVSTPKPVKPKPIDFPIEPDKQTSHKVKVTFYGTTCNVYFRPDMRFSLGSVSEKNVGKIWKLLSSDHYTSLLADCRSLHEKMQLGDYGLLRLAETVAQETLGKGNEAVILQTYIMTQFGYDVRLCQQGNKLGMIVPFKQVVCNTPYYQIDGTSYYVWDKSMQSGTVSSYKQNIKDATRQIDLQMTSTPRFASLSSAARTFVSERYPAAHVSVATDNNLMAFYNDYPMMQDWGVYAAQPMEPRLTAQVYPKLRTALKGKSETEAADILLNFVQTGFKYQTDEQQFGQEKYNFGEESFHYPACDCEDRSILFAHLIRDLVGLNVILLHYPNHLATAVHFNQTVNGNSVNVNGKRYTICDPTYINAGIGMCMKKFIGVRPTVYLIPTSR